MHEPGPNTKPITSANKKTCAVISTPFSGPYPKPSWSLSETINVLLHYNKLLSIISVCILYLFQVLI